MAVTETVGSAEIRSAWEESSPRAERTLAWMLIVGGIAAFILRKLPDIGDALRLALPDNDDMMRLQAVRDLLAGQSWFDPTQYRYLPPEGVLMHWSRLVDLPLALGIAGLSPVLGPDWAERIVAAFWPLALFLVFAGMAGRTTWRLFGPVAAGAAVLVAGQMVVFRDIFAPGRIDHHNIQVILTVAAALAFCAGRRWSGVASGTLIGLSLAVGLETLPFVALIALAFALCWVVDGGAQSAAFARFGASLAVTLVVAFAIQTAPERWLTPACDALSTPWLLLTAGGGAVALVLSAMTPRLRARQVRLGAGALAGAALVAAFVLLFPSCLEGPYVAVPQPYRDIWLNAIGEARPFVRLFADTPATALGAVAPLCIAAIAVTVGALCAAAVRRRALALLAALLWTGSALALVQTRTLYISAGFLPIAAAWLTGELLGAGRHAGPRVRIAGMVGLVLMLELPWMLAVIFLGPAPAAAQREAAAGRLCTDPRSLSALAALPSGVVLAQVDVGPDVLLHTPHSIIVAGFHRAPAGIIAGIEAFDGDEAAMRRVVERFGVDILAICPPWLDRAEPAAFAQQLVEGRSVPWLRPLDLDAGPLKVWRVER
jgi:hypothetical protein